MDADATRDTVDETVQEDMLAEPPESLDSDAPADEAEQADEQLEQPEEDAEQQPEADASASPRSADPGELFLGRNWGIVPEVLVELSARADVRADAAEIEAARANARRMALAQPAANGASTVAVIPLCGVVTPRGSLLARLFGYASGLEGFRDSFREALADDNVSAILIDVDSPGGLIDQVPETAAEIFGARGSKPIVAVANTMCASAAYWLASQADELVVTPSGQVGSIGVFTVHQDVSRLEQAMGVKVTMVSAGRFKTEGNPYEPLSKQAQAAMQSNVDDIYGMFTADVARGRKTSIQAVQAGYGEGRMLLAERAFALKMVDRVESFEQTLARLGATGSDEDESEPTDVDVDVDVEIAPDDDTDDGDLGAQAAGGSRSDAVAADYLSSGHAPSWQIGASRSPVSGRL